MSLEIKGDSCEKGWGQEFLRVIFHFRTVEPLSTLEISSSNFLVHFHDSFNFYLFFQIRMVLVLGCLWIKFKGVETGGAESQMEYSPDFVI
nr:hypothetical protein Itr_chr15CG07880 [Ipomoea trifida]